MSKATASEQMVDHVKYAHDRRLYDIKRAYLRSFCEYCRDHGRGVDDELIPCFLDSLQASEGGS